MIENIRVAEISKGFNREIVFDSEKEGIKFARRSIVSLQKITVGTTITKNMIGVKRPGTGIYPKFFDSIIGKKAIRDIGEDQPLEWEDIEKKNI